MNDEKIKNLLERNIVDAVERADLEKELKSGKKLRIKLGIDPTGPKLHLGRAIVLWKLKEFQELGHQIVLIIGDFTALVGDASDKQSARQQLTKEEIAQNMKNYQKQIGKILDIKKTEFRKNSEWLGKLKFEDIMRLASLFTVQQLINRRNFKERYEEEQPIGFQEFLYPLMQGYDSVAIKADVELGGTDQLFNLMAGRKIQEFFGQKPQNLMTVDMLAGLDGRKMSTSWGNIINILDEPKEMFGKVMSMKDEYITNYFTLTTRIPILKIKEIETGIKENKINPIDAKKELAHELVKTYHGEKEAQNAQAGFEKTFQNKELPEDAPSFSAQKGEELGDVLVREKIIESKAEFRRLIKTGSIDFEGAPITDVHKKIAAPGVIKIGKKKFAKLEIN